MNFENLDWKKVLAAVAVAMLILAGLIEPGTFIRPGGPEEPDDPFFGFAGATTGFDSLSLTRDLTVAGDATLGGDLDVTGDTTLTGGLEISGSAALAFLTLEAGTAISVTAGATITPTTTYQPLTSAAAVTTSTTTAVADGSAAGQLLILHNQNASDAITVDGAGANVECGGNVALGANDVLSLVWDGDDWFCLALRDN